MRINGGYFVLRQGIFDYLEEGDDLVMDGCCGPPADGRLRAVRYDGFWAPMDTLKERTLWRTSTSTASAPGRCGGNGPSSREAPCGPVEPQASPEGC